MNGKIKKFITNLDSMTLQLKKLESNFSVSVISHEFINDYFYRYTNIYLNSILMTSNISYTPIQNTQFLNILLKASTNPIGLELFNPINKIQRNSDIIINEIIDYNNNLNIIIKKLNYDPIFKFARKSHFSLINNSQHKLFLYEYLTQDLINLLLA
jgi:chorismate-pyruvate lyase